MGKDRRVEKKEVDESLGKKGDKFGQKGDGKIVPQQGPDKSFSHQECRHILVEKQGEALRISEEIHEGKITFNEAAFKYSMDKAGAFGLLGWKNVAQVRGRLRYTPGRTILPNAHGPRHQSSPPPFAFFDSSTRTSGRRRSRARRATGFANP